MIKHDNLEFNLNGKIIKYKRLSDFNIGIDKKILLSEDRHNLQ